VTGKADSILDLSSNRQEQAADQSVVAGETSACVALVPVVAAANCSRNPEPRLSRADFITQLIAAAEHVPQTRALRRGTSADAKAAYGASWHELPVQRPGIRTRQIV
jgi:hypothetical protein